MKSISIAAFFSLILFLSPDLQAQQSETLFSGSVRHGGYGALFHGVTSLNGQATYLKGSKGAWVIRFDNGNALHVGFSGYRSDQNFDVVNWRESGNEIPELKTNYGGFELEYTIRSLDLFHFGFQTLVGSGDVRYQNGSSFDKKSDNFFVVQPGASLYVNVTSWFRISGSVLYRYASNVNLAGTSDTDLSGLSVAAGLRFGKF
ncbi:MAG: hypothetical protein EA360_06240 [Balneolaceae bacterium]|nr:MAG: hypothetical protein EA360_06240 [Balneolaceae bacterium]